MILQEIRSTHTCRSKQIFEKKTSALSFGVLFILCDFANVFTNFARILSDFARIFTKSRDHRGPKIQCRLNVDTQSNFNPTNWNMKHKKAVKLGGPLKKVLIHYSHFWVLWKQGIYTLQLLLGPIWKQNSLRMHYSCCCAPLRARCFTHNSCKGVPEASVSITFPWTHYCT